MLTAFLQGGLGNQLFQISNAISRALKENKICKFIPYTYTPMQARGAENYLDNIYRNIDFSMSEDEYRSSTILEGYFQDIKYFEQISEEIKNLFSPSLDFLEKIYYLYPDLLFQKTLSIHVRRGDYLTVSTKLPVVNISYINKAIEIAGDYDVVYIFSDDKEWIKNNLKIKNSIVVEGLEDYEELWMMSLCHNNITSNSTFSWWGSFLNKNPFKKVIVPNLWFGPDSIMVDNIYMENFIKVPVFYKEGFLEALE